MSVPETALRNVVVASDLEEEDDLFEPLQQPNEEQVPRTLEGLTLRGEVVRDFADYRNVVFTRDVSLRDVRFAKGFSFAGARFLGRATLFNVSNDRIRGNSASFAGATFNQQVRANRGCAFYLADFSSATFLSNAKFKGCRFYAAARFDGAKFAGPANFDSAVFNGSGHFNDARFASSADFERVIFRYSISHARFAEAHFVGPAIFKQAQFSGHADFTSAIFHSGVTFYRAKFALEKESEDDASDELDQTGIRGGDQADLTVSYDGAVFMAVDDGDTATFEGVKFGDRNFRRYV